jgi:hypothetical protein
MRRVEAVCSVVVLLLLSSVSIPTHSQGAGPDLTPCGSARPAPAQSGTWGVPFCNRTQHDVVVQFHDNDCPADNWSRRGDVYEKRLARGETVTVFLCYAHETGGNPPAGVPVLRIPGGKGVVTTWSVVGDCGDRSDRQHLDTRSFYDRGSYETGIILLQQPEQASHCFGAEAPTAALPPTPPSGTSAASSSPAVAPAPGAAVIAAPAAALAATTPSSAAAAPAAAAAPVPAGGPPSLSAAIEPNSTFTRAVNVFATSAPGGPDYRCHFRLALDFSDGSSWIDQLRVDVHTGAQNAPVLTRRYLKTVTKVELNSQKCDPR